MSGTPTKTFANSGACITQLNQTVVDISHRSTTPSCLLQPRTAEILSTNDPIRNPLSRISMTSSATTPSVTTTMSTMLPGQIPCPRYDPKYAFRHKDGVSFPLEPFAANGFFAYSGDFVESTRHGSGIIVGKDGSSLAGDFCSGEITYGIHTWPDGTVYKGPMLKGEAHGVGEKYYSHGGVAYKGEFRFGHCHGRGKWSRYKDEEVYDGIFVENKRCGQGQLSVKGAFAYEGEFLDDQFEGNGTYQVFDSLASFSSRYTGQFSRGLPHGMGTLKTPDGIDYYGLFFEGRRVDIPVSLLPIHVRIRDLTPSNYIQAGLSPASPTCYAGMPRLDRENHLMQDPYIQVHPGVPILVAVAQAREVIEDPTGAGSAPQAPKPGGKDAKRGSVAPSVASRTPLGRGSAASVSLRARHLVDDICVRATMSTSTAESGRKVTFRVLAVPVGCDPFNCPLKQLLELTNETLFLEDTSSEVIALSIGEVLASKSGPGGGIPALKVGQLSVSAAQGPMSSRLTPRSNTSKQNTSRHASNVTPRRDGSVAATQQDDDRVAFELPPPRAPFTSSVTRVLRNGQCNATLRLSSVLPLGEYVIVGEVPSTERVLYTNWSEKIPISVVEVRIPIRIVAMEFQVQRAYIMAFQTGSAAALSKDVLGQEQEDDEEGSDGSNLDEDGEQSPSASRRMQTDADGFNVEIPFDGMDASMNGSQGHGSFRVEYDEEQEEG